ncbi:MAG: MarR family EPS-associated transcriptional regulator [Desulfobacula sp.]|nr:MarR family EPS-associated transcriptional regulator [Desulfobacula sp.]
MNTFIDEEIHLKILRLLQDNSRITQREMNQKMGVSVGKINYCISALSEKGLIKIERFNKAHNKSAYMYRLTPKGFEEIARLTLSFLKLKVSEYNRIKLEIQSLYGQVNQTDLESCNDPGLLTDLKTLSKM